MKKIKFTQEYIVLFAIIVMIIVFGILNPNFLRITNIVNISRQISVFSLIAIGQAIVLISGGFDLSVGAIVGLSACMVAALIGTYSVFLAILITIAIGFGVGSVNGLLVSKGKMNPFLATLAMMTIIRGIVLLWTKGAPIFSDMPDSLTFFGRGYIGGIPVQVIFVAIIALVFHLIISKNLFGRYIYAIGGNEEASRISGIKVDRIRIYTFGITGLLSSLGGILLTARLNSGQPMAGQGYELESIAMAVIGGISLSGGEGSILGCMLGVLFMGVLKNGLNLLNVSSFLQEVITGLIIIATVIWRERSGGD
jgi:ribose transport system permease protein